MRYTDKKKIFSLSGCFAFFMLLAFSFFSHYAAAEKGYTSLAPIPNVPGNGVSLPDYLQGLFSIGVGLAIVFAVLMIVIGGIQYVLAAVPSAKNDGKKKIQDSIWGLLLILFSYIILKAINPELLYFGLNLKAITIVPVGTSSGGGSGSGGGGSCTPVTKPGPCTVENLSGSFGSNASKASSICNGESGGNASLTSSCDKCQDGNGFSIGLFQINMIDSATSVGCNTNGEIFTTGTSKGSKVSCSGACCVWSCKVKDMAGYVNCKTKLQDAKTNTNVAYKLSNGGSNWSRWGANRNCGY